MMQPSETMLIRRATMYDEAGVWAIMEPVIRAGETYTLDPDLSCAAALAYWFGPEKDTFVLEVGGVVRGTYYLRVNQGGGGRHVCNCGYMTHPDASGQGIARAMCLHSLEHARMRHFQAMQFNFVVSTNIRALRLWQALGFDIVGRLPAAFNHPLHGMVDALIMFRRL